MNVRDALSRINTDRSWPAVLRDEAGAASAECHLPEPCDLPDDDAIRGWLEARIHRASADRVTGGRMG